MDLNHKLYLERGKNEIQLGRIIFQVSNEKDIQLDIFKVSEPDTYFSSVITHAYYCIFYSAKAYLIKRGIKTEAPEEHKKTYEEFKKLVDEGTIDVELLNIYEKMIIRSESLLGIFKIEKKKRGEFTYQKLPQANLEPAQESLKNAEIFFRHTYNLCEK